MQTCSTKIIFILFPIGVVFLSHSAAAPTWAPTECFQPLYLPYSQIELYSFHSEASRMPFADPVGVTSARNPPFCSWAQTQANTIKSVFKWLMNAERTEGSWGAEALGNVSDRSTASEHTHTVSNNQPNRVYTTNMVRNDLNGFFEPFKGAFSSCLEINWAMRTQSAGTKLCKVHLQKPVGNL